MWHQHQPFYKDTVSEIYRMPWVFMHAVKDYRDMLYLIEKNNIKATFNLVPILIYQLKDYGTDPLKDELLRIVTISPDRLQSQEKKILFNYAFDAMNPAKISQSAYFRDLLHLYHSGEEFNNGQITDVQAFLLLSWLGEVAFMESSTLQSLREKGQSYTQADKEKIFELSMEIVRSVVSEHARAWKENKIEIVTSPFFHPIIPLLKSFESARVSIPDLPLPGLRANMQDDAFRQVKDGKEYVNKEMGKTVRGFWPSEGALSPFAAECYAKNGIEYIMGDEGILAKSLELAGISFQKKDLYSPWVYNTPEGDIKIFFRDTQLSDLIGFTYSRWETQDAVNNFIARLKNIYDTSEQNPVVNVILDGENAWESYKNNGYDFLDALYKAIAKSDFIEPLTFSEVIDSDTYFRPLPKLFSGSWIYANLNTWVGHSEKNRAWELLVQVKKIFEENKNKVDEKILQRAHFELMAAEGSDWFWWYGDDFYSHFSDDFDELFRLHLKNVCNLLQVEIPDNLHLSLRKQHRGGLITHPSGYLSIKLDGRLEGFFDWLGAGQFDLGYDAATMQMGSRRLKELRFGPTKNLAYGVVLGLINDFSNCTTEILEVYILDSEMFKIQWDLKNKKIIFLSDNLNPDEIKIAQDQILEIFVPMKRVEEKLMVQFKILKDGQVLEIAPMYSMATLPVGFSAHSEWII